MKRAIHAPMATMLALGMALLTGNSVAQNSTFTVRQLPPTISGTSMYVFDIEAGEPVGYVCANTQCSSTVATVWTGLTPTTLGQVAGTDSSEGHSINSAGQVAGVAYSGNYPSPTNWQAVVWTNGVPTSLTIPGSASAVPSIAQINSSGQVAGSVATAGPTSQLAVVWNGSTPTLLDLLPGYTSAYAGGINDSGLIVGSMCCSPTSNYSAVVWHGTTPTALPGFGGKIQGSRAQSVNNAGVVVGVGGVPGSSAAGAIAWVNGAATSLAAYDPGTESSAQAINNRGVIVGFDIVEGTEHPLVWSGVGSPAEELNTLITPAASNQLIVSKPIAIDDNCSIVAIGISKKTSSSLFLLLTLADPSKCVKGGF